MNTENPQSFILKAVKELAAISEESVINTSALCPDESPNDFYQNH
ncbi:hypothetical protein ACRWYR_20115 [Escherichia coli]